LLYQVNFWQYPIRISVAVDEIAKLIDNQPLFLTYLRCLIMQVTMLKAKLHRATVTRSELGYEGSCAIAGDILDLCGIREYEQIQIYNVNNGARFTTYAIRAEAGTGIFSVNGAAARLACPGDLIIVCAYVQLDEQELQNYQPTLVYFDANNQVLRQSNAIPVQAA
jgi:aspartate 1-decarboxylase